MPSNFEHIVLVGTSFVLLFQIYRVTTIECGTVNFVRPTILGGTDAIKSEWPFLAAIEKNSKYICGGTIISNRHILTAAHCIQGKFSETVLSPHEIVVRLGAFNLTNNNEEGAIQRNVSEVIIHEDWDAFEKRFDADIAILVLSENITFTDDIQPVCMPGNSVDGNMEGSVVGYIVRRSTVRAEIPRRIIVKTVNSSHCFREDDGMGVYASNRTFCGGDGDGSPDQGDSGSGYFFTPGFSWAQYGLVATVRTNSTGHAFPYAYHIYTNVTMFKDWIIETVNRTGGEVGEARKNIILTCDYGYNRDSVKSIYNCKVYNIDIQGNDFETGSFGGSHLREETHRDVEEIHFVNGTMTHLPSGFGMFFENLRYLIVGGLTPASGSLTTKVVRRSDFRNLKRLGMISFFRNEVETLHEDALWDLPELRSLILIENRLRVLANETFSKNKKLIEVNFRSNQLKFLPANLFRNNPMLRAVDFQNNALKVIDENIFRTNRRLTLVDFGSNQLETLPKRLFQSNLYLKLVHFESNSLSSIDEDLFATNVMLLAVFFYSNRIDSLPPKLFRNNLRLSVVDFDNNSIATIEENLFINNEKLFVVSFANNRLEGLQRNVLRNASALNTLNLPNNQLRSIDIDFTEFKQVDVINLNQNDCVNETYMKRNATGFTSGISFGNLLEFQNLVIANCSNVL